MEHEKYLPLVLDAIKDAGKQIMEIYHSTITVETKKDNSPVTQADLLSNKILTQYLKTTNISILSEESEDLSSRENEEYVWIIDPIDGTRGFINRDGEFAIQIGLAYKGTPVLGAVYSPARDKLYYAIKDKGSFLIENGVEKKLQVTHKDNFDNAHVFMSKNHVTPEMIDFAKELGFKEVGHCGGIGVKFGLIAEGVSDLDFKLGGYCAEWDLCAPQIIIEEAGGFVYDTYGNPLRYNTHHTKISNGYIATTLTNKEEILKHIMSFRK